MMSFVFLAIKHWRLSLAALGVVGLLLGGTVAYVKGRMDASHAAKVARINETINTLNENINRAKRAAEADRKEAEKAASEAAELERKVQELDEYIANLPPQDRDRQCLDRSDAQRLRQLWK